MLASLHNWLYFSGTNLDAVIRFIGVGVVPRGGYAGRSSSAVGERLVLLQDGLPVALHGCVGELQEEDIPRIRRLHAVSELDTSQHESSFVFLVLLRMLTRVSSYEITYPKYKLPPTYDTVSFVMMSERCKALSASPIVNVQESQVKSLQGVEFSHGGSVW